MVYMGNDNIIELYKKAWENHDLSIVEMIFDCNVKYQEKHNNVIVGLNSLKKYWIGNSLKQKNVSFLPIKIIHHDNNIVVEWEANYFDINKSKNVKLYGLMWLYIRNNKIYDFKECFNKSYV